MIIVQLTGGLGNQMFQYAAAKALAHKHNTVLKYDFFIRRGDILRYFSLGYFNVKIEKVSKIDLDKITKLSNNIFLRKFGFFNRIIKEKYLNFDQSFLKLPNNVLLIGYWQSEKYFKDIEDIIRSDFTFKNPMDRKNKEISKCIQKIESVGMHVRRGDYVTDKRTNQFHGICGLDYYNRAVSFIEKRVKSPYFFIFSDDPKWVKSNIRLSHPVYNVDFNRDGKSYEDMRLLSLCRHNIIANSSFSWWGAWLNRNPNKIVIAPKKWFNDQTIITKDLIPNNWIRL